MPPDNTSVTWPAAAGQATGAAAGWRGPGRAAVLEIQLCPGNAQQFRRAHALFAKARAAQNMRRDPAIGVDPHLARAEHQARFADIMHRLLLLGRQARAHPDEAAVRVGEARGQAVNIHFGENAPQVRAPRAPGPTMRRVSA